MRVKWQKMCEKATAMLGVAHACTASNRPNIQSLLNILDEAALLPIPEQAPGGRLSIAHKRLLVLDFLSVSSLVGA